MRGSHSHLGFHLTKHCAASLSRSTGESFNKSARMRSQVTFLSKERGVRLSCMKKEKKKRKKGKERIPRQLCRIKLLIDEVATW